MCLVQGGNSILPAGAIAIHSRLSCNIFRNEELLEDVKHANKSIILYENSGELVNNQIRVHNGACM